MNLFLKGAIITIIVFGCSSDVDPDDIEGTPAPELTIVDYITGLGKPWDVTWTPNGDMLFTENDSGNISVENAGTVTSIHTISDLAASGEGGLMGIILSPTFDSDYYVFVCYTSNAPDIRIVRFKTNVSLTSMTNKTPIVTGGPYSSGRHSGCRLKFGPDGYLWVVLGDAAIGSTPQNNNSLGGKILRVVGRSRYAAEKQPPR